MQHALASYLGRSSSSGLLLRKYGDAAAAYSLQNLGGSGSNVIRSRRSTDDAEDNFTAQQVSGGQLREFALNNDADLIRFADQAAAADKRMYFDGSNDSVTLTSAITLTSATNWRVDFSIMIDQGVTDFAILGDPSNDGIYFQSSLGTLTITGGGVFRGITGLSLNTQQIYNLSLRCDGSNIELFDITGGGSSSLGFITVSSLVDLDVSVIGNRATRWAKGLLYDVKIDNTANDTDWVAQWNGYGNTDADWEDQVGANDGTVNGSPALFSGQGFDAFVTTWYDQSGNGRNATQSTAASQPQIVASGVVVTDANGNASLDFDGTDDSLTPAVAASTLSAFHVSAIASSSNGSGVFAGIYSPNTTAGSLVLLARAASGDKWGTFSGPAASSDFSALSLLTMESADGNTGTYYKDGSSDGSFTATQGQAPAHIGGIAAQYLNGKVGEIVYYETDQSSNRAAIESNIANRYGITI